MANYFFPQRTRNTCQRATFLAAWENSQVEPIRLFGWLIFMDGNFPETSIFYFRKGTGLLPVSSVLPLPFLERMAGMKVKAWELYAWMATALAVCFVIGFAIGWG